MSIEEEARAEAEREYPLPNDLSTVSRTLRLLAREHYANGYIAGASRQPETAPSDTGRSMDITVHGILNDWPLTHRIVDALIAEGFSRSQPVQVAPSDTDRPTNHDGHEWEPWTEDRHGTYCGNCGIWAGKAKAGVPCPSQPVQVEVTDDNRETLAYWLGQYRARVTGNPVWVADWDAVDGLRATLGGGE